MTKFNMHNSTVCNDIDILLGHYIHVSWQIYIIYITNENVMRVILWNNIIVMEKVWCAENHNLN